MRYHYRAVNDQGQIQLGQLDAGNLTDLEQRLQRIGLTLIRARNGQGKRPGSGKIARRELVTFCFHLEQLTSAGVPLIEALLDLRDSVDHPRLREVIANQIEAIEGGQPFSQALAAHPAIFDPVFIGLIKAGEACGELPEVLLRLYESLKWQDELATQTRKILMYPAFVGTLVFGVLSFLMIYLIPQLADFIQSMGQTLPLSSRLLIAASSFFSTYWWLLAGLTILAMAFIQFRLKTSAAFRQKLDGWKIRLPLVGPILHKIILARFVRFFAMLYASGIPVLECLRISESVVGNAVIAETLAELGARIRAGQGVSASFGASRLFPPLLLRMLHLGESTGQLDKALLNVAYFYDRDIREAIERIQRLIEPVLTVILGLALAWIMSAVLGPIFDTIGKLR